MKKASAVLIGSAMGLAAGQAAASGFAVSEQSVSAMGTAFAGSGVLSEDATNQWYNPATLAGLDQTELSLAIHQVLIDASFKANGAAGPGDIDDIDPLVGSGFLAVPIAENMTFGLGINAPFGTKIEYDPAWGNAPGIGDLYATESDLKTYNINPALGIQVTDALRVGVGVSYQRVEADIRSALTELEGDDDSYGWNLGVAFDADDNNHFGLAYRSEVDYDIDGDITYTPLAAGPFAGKYSGSTDLTLPASFNVSYAGDLSDRTQILLGVEWMEWSSLDRLVIEHTAPAPIGNPAIMEFDWSNTTRYSFGVRHALDDSTVLRFGVAKEDSTQETDNRSPTSPDSEKVWVTLGAGFVPMENMEIDVGYAHVFVDDADTFRTEFGLLDGKYELDADILGAQLNYRF